MKKYIAFLITIIMAVSIISCGGNNNKEPEPSIGDQMYEKYKSIIDKLEGENYDGAIEEIQAMKPAPTVQEVEITADNFFDYYDIVYWENQIDRDADGKITKVSRVDDWFDFKLKDEYLFDTDQDNSVEIGVTCEYDLKKIENVDPETGEIVYGEESFDEYEDEILEANKRYINSDSVALSVTCKGSQMINCHESSELCCERWINIGGKWKMNSDISPDDYEGYAFLPTDIQITRAEGTLHLIQK